MNLRSRLRLINHCQTALELLRNHHAGSEVINLDTGGRYLQLVLSNAQQLQSKALLNVDLWLQEMDHRLPGIPWQQVPLSYIKRWLESIDLSFVLRSGTWNVELINFPAPTLPEKVLSLPAHPCSLYCVDWLDDTYSTLYQSRRNKNTISFIVNFVLGHSQLSLDLIIDIAVGDFLLIKNNFPYLKIGKIKLFPLSLTHNQEVIVLEQDIEAEEDNRDEEEDLLKWSDLPVEIEFVLDSKSVTLAELNSIQPGTAFSLNKDAEQKVKIYLNRKFFARGELVALENGTLAVEVTHINTVSVGEMEISDA